MITTGGEHGPTGDFYDCSVDLLHGMAQGVSEDTLKGVARAPSADGRPGRTMRPRRILDGRGMLYGQADATVDTGGQTVEQSLRALKKAVSLKEVKAS